MRPVRTPRPPLLVFGLLVCGLFFGAGDTAQAERSTGEAVWRLGRSDFLRYERVEITTKDGKEKRSPPQLVTVYGHDLSDGERRGQGQYAPAAPRFEDLPQLLALRLVAPGQRESAVKFDWRAHRTAPVRIKGTVRIDEVQPRFVELSGTFQLKARGKPEQEDRWQIKSGEARTAVTWDGKGGVVTKARIDLSYERRNLQAKGSPKSKIQRTYELTLADVRRMRPTDFQKSVDEAIAKGVAHLRTLQIKDGTFKPFQEWTIGTTALATLALLSCGVPANDPQVKQALDWIFAQTPERTYDQAACLLAIDRAYTPQKELDAMQRGNAIETFERDLPTKRKVWVLDIAEALEKAAPSKGSWGYPSASNNRVKRDTSNTQYAVLGMRAALHLGYAVDADTWRGVIRHCEELQELQGPKGRVSLVRRGQAIPDEASAHTLYEQKVPAVAGFRYATVSGHEHVDGSMTCAGISCLLIARHELLRLDCEEFSRKEATRIDDLINGGWAWLDAHWAVDRHPGHPAGRWLYYYLYCLERAGILGDVRRVGGRDWYFEGAAQLIARQHDNGSWNHRGLGSSTGGANGWSGGVDNDTPPTCFALLFLKKGTPPLAGVITCK